jgi:protease II
MINCGSKSTNEIHVIDRETGILRCLINRKEECRIFCNHVGDRFFVLTNKDLKTKEKCYDYKVITMKQSSTDKPAINKPNNFQIETFY